MNPQILILSQTEAESLGPIRCLPGILAAKQDGEIWLKSTIHTEHIALKIRQLPALHTYSLRENENLFPDGALTPIGRLPPLDWKPLNEFVPVELPPSGLPAELRSTLPVRVVASGSAEKGAALLSAWSDWADYAETAPDIRLQRLRFAAGPSEKVLILGDILPPLRGQEYWLQNSLLLPAGYDFEYPVISTLLQKKYNPDASAYLLFDENGAWEKIERTCFKKATRSAVRLTTKACKT